VLATYIERGYLLQAAGQRGDDPERVERLHAHWMSSAESYLARKLGRSYAAQFREARGHAPRRSASGDPSSIVADIGAEVDALAAILSKIEHRRP
jgi:hypothetical protein